MVCGCVVWVRGGLWVCGVGEGWFVGVWCGWGVVCGWVVWVRGSMWVCGMGEGWYVGLWCA